MKWYLVKLVFGVSELDQPENAPAKFDEQLRLIEEETHDLALLKARRLGKKFEGSFFRGEHLTTWTFIDVKDVVLLDVIQDGIEIYSDMIETNDRESFINSVLLRSLHLSARTPVLF